MEKTIELAVGRVIEKMRANLGEELTVDDMARTAMFSKFHFSRFFQRVTGVSPGRFLSAMRLHEAKELLVSTSLTVTAISHRVGYTSVGTFSTRFTDVVGVSPTTYRQLSGFVTNAEPMDEPPVPTGRSGREPAPRGCTVSGEIVADTEPQYLGLIFVGLFADRIPRGQPIRSAVLHRPGAYRLDSVPPGTWYLLAHSVAAGLEAAVRSPGVGDQTLCAGTVGPIKIGPGGGVQHADLRLEAAAAEPMLDALLNVRSVSLALGPA